jgi:catechol 2,3-dioxygenase-like lactoylglutathione lyase family enzyme
MTSRISEICFDCTDAERMAEFWCAVLGYRVGESDDEGIELIGQPSSPVILMLRDPRPKREKNRLHLDINAVDRTQEEEVERILALGATRIDIGQGEPTWVVLADPEGNEFCVLRSTQPPEPEALIRHVPADT